MKKLLFLVIITCSLGSLQAQTSSTNFSLGVEGALPIGTFGDFYSFGIGASGQVEYKPSSNTGFTLNAGYLNYSYKKSVLGNGSTGFIPVLAGVKYFFSPKVYGHAQLGASFSTTSGGSTNFTYSPGIGFQLSNSVDALIKFVGLSSSGFNYNSIALRLAYTFPH